MMFDPKNHVVQLCLKGMAAEEQGKSEEAAQVFRQAWDQSQNNFEKFLAAHYLARVQNSASEKLQWLERGLQAGLQVNDDSVRSAFPAIYASLAKCHEELGDTVKAASCKESAAALQFNPADAGPFYHGTRAALKIGDLLTAGGSSNYKSDLKMNHIYFTALANGAGLAAALAKGEQAERVYVVEPTGPFENDPNVTDKKFPGNPTRSYRSQSPLKIVGELQEWVRQTPEDIQKWRERLANSKGEIIN